MKPALLRVFRVVGLAFRCLALLLAVIAVEFGVSWNCVPQGSIPAPVPQPEQRKAAVYGIKDYVRPEDDAYLSYPEWYIVWSYQEKADFQQNNLPSEFPYLAAVRQYWNSYCCISRLTRGKFSFNASEQVMLVIIGTSFSAEYILKAAYENTIGRISERTSDHQLTSEDQYAYKVAREYAGFVHVRPFYEFRFAREVPGLWTQNSWFGPHALRKLERKIFLTFDYLAEAFYCWFIQKGTYATYGHEPDRTYAWVEYLSDDLLTQLPNVKLVKRIDTQAAIVDIPRYQAFTTTAGTMAQHEVHFLDIAGNSQITLSVIGPENWRPESNSPASPLFSQPILTRPGWQRVVLACPVTQLDTVLRTLSSNTTLTLEHIYDY